MITDEQRETNAILALYDRLARTERELAHVTAERDALAQIVRERIGETLISTGEDRQ